MKKTFEVDNKKYAVVEPSREAMSKARIEHSKAIGEGINSNAPFRASLFKHMRAQGLWDDEKEEKYQTLMKTLEDGEVKLRSGGIKLAEARQIAIDMRKARFDLRILLAEQTQLDAFTVEGAAENARFDTLAAMCIIDDETGKSVYNTLENYELHKSDDVAVRGATLFAQIYYNYDENAELQLPENEFLIKWKFADKTGRLINNDGKFVDVDGKLLNELGQYIDEEGNVINTEGRLIDDTGKVVVEFSPFLDDDGNPINTKDESSAEQKTE